MQKMVKMNVIGKNEYTSGDQAAFASFKGIESKLFALVAVFMILCVVHSQVSNWYLLAYFIYLVKATKFG